MIQRGYHGTETLVKAPGGVIGLTLVDLGDGMVDLAMQGTSTWEWEAVVEPVGPR
jgi:hypothetical protein